MKVTEIVWRNNHRSKDFLVVLLILMKFTKSRFCAIWALQQ